MTLQIIVVLALIPVFGFGFMRGRVGRRTFLAMLDEIKNEGAAIDAKEAQALLPRWIRNPKSVIAVADAEDMRAVIAIHAERAVAAMRPWKLAGRIWMITGFAGLFAWIAIK